MCTPSPAVKGPSEPTTSRCGCQVQLEGDLRLGGRGASQRNHAASRTTRTVPPGVPVAPGRTADDVEQRLGVVAAGGTAPGPADGQIVPLTSRQPRSDPATTDRPVHRA